MPTPLVHAVLLLVLRDCFEVTRTIEVYGTGKEYQLMYRNFREQFAKQNVTNAVFVLIAAGVVGRS